MSGPRSSFLERLLRSLDAPTTRQNLDDYDEVDAIRLLKGDELREAEDALIAKLDGNDGRAANALGLIGSPRALEALRNALVTSTRPVVRVFAARNLLQAAGDAGGIDAVIQAAQTGTEDQKLIAVSTLKLFRETKAYDALERAFSDADGSVRIAALDGLLERYGVLDGSASKTSTIGMLEIQLASRFASERLDAQQKLTELFKKFREGSTPEQLGVHDCVDESKDSVNTFMKSLESREPPWGDTLALDSLTALTGSEREWAEHLLIARLPYDFRAAAALAHLKARRAIEPMRELLSTPPNEAIRAAVEASLKIIEG